LVPSVECARFDRPFTTSPTAASVTLYQSVEGVGWVEVDDVSLRTHTPRRLARPLVSLTFDDGTRSHHDVALPALQASGLRGTFYLVSGYLDDARSQFLTTDMAKELARSGMEIGSHTVSHPRLPGLSPAEVRHELGDSRKELEHRLSVRVEDFASPFGESTPTVRDEARARYRSHRTVEGRHNLVEFLDPARLEGRLVLDTTTPADVEGWLREAEAEGGWVILIFHDLRTQPGDYDTTPEAFQQMIDAVERSGLTVRTVSEARREVLAQT
jgi:peptidoglycan/xylan/chitin deacetylase (PgdA/CDA1 family)